ncbi:MAG: hypothetical protein ABIE55_00100 [Candidatus Aenigmatarchaeota archaeon]
MEWIAFVKKENVSKAENAVKGDLSTASRQSITVKDAKGLGIEKEGSFFLISGSDEGVEEVKGLMKEYVEDAKEDELNKAKEKIKEEEDKAATGFGGIFG